jgi:hypothetical protein
VILAHDPRCIGAAMLAMPEHVEEFPGSPPGRLDLKAIGGAPVGHAHLRDEGQHVHHRGAEASRYLRYLGYLIVVEPGNEDCVDLDDGLRLGGGGGDAQELSLD